MTRKPCLATVLKEWDLNYKSSSPPGWGLSRRPTISSHKKKSGAITPIDTESI